MFFNLKQPDLDGYAERCGCNSRNVNGKTHLVKIVNVYAIDFVIKKSSKAGSILWFYGCHFLMHPLKLVFGETST